jgi:putative hemolysin
MRSGWFGTVAVCVTLFLACFCEGGDSNARQDVGLPNPASVYCAQKGGRLELRTDAEGAVQGICVFFDGSECDEWAYFRDECSPAGETREGQPSAQATPSPMPLADDETVFSSEDYQGWWTYQNSDYGFSFMLPEDWAVEAMTTADPMMNGHFLMLQPRIETGNDLNIRLSFRRIGEDVLLWPTGVGAGEFVPMGGLDAAGQMIRRFGFKCPGGEISDIWYHGPEETGPNIQIDGLEFGFIASKTGDYCQEGIAIEDKSTHLSDMIIASLKMQ